MDSKRIRFGLVCRNTSFITADMLPSLRVRSLECALLAEKQFVVFTVEKPIKACDVLKSIDEFNGSATEPLTLEKFNEDDESMIVLFEKGQRFLQHPFYAAIQEVRDSSSTSGGEEPKIWEWTADGVPDSSRHHHNSKRVVGELASDLVEDSILPSAPKRARAVPKSTEVMLLLLLLSLCVCFLLS